MNKDKYGIIGQIQPDGSIEGGDSANWSGHYVYFTGDNQPNFVETFEVESGAYVRHPDPEQTNNGFGAYYKNPYNGCISRDQLTGIIGALIKLEDRAALLRAIKHHFKSGFLFAYNTIKNGEKPETAKRKMPDLTLFEIWAMYLRGFGKLSYIFYPILCILDLHMLLTTLYINHTKDPDVISYLMKFAVSQDYVPTITSKFYDKILDKDKIDSHLKEYWCGWRRLPEMYEIHRKYLQ